MLYYHDELSCTVVLDKDGQTAYFFPVVRSKYTVLVGLDYATRSKLRDFGLVIPFRGFTTPARRGSIEPFMSDTKLVWYNVGPLVVFFDNKHCSDPTICALIDAITSIEI